MGLQVGLFKALRCTRKEKQIYHYLSVQINLPDTSLNLLMFAFGKDIIFLQSFLGFSFTANVQTQPAYLSFSAHFNQSAAFLR